MENTRVVLAITGKDILIALKDRTLVVTVLRRLEK